MKGNNSIHFSEGSVIDIVQEYLDEKLFGEKIKVTRVESELDGWKIHFQSVEEGPKEGQ